MKRLLLDTGPLVALLSARDTWHAWAVETFSELRGPLTTCEAVLTETCHLLRGSPAAVAAVLRRVDEGVLRVEPMAGHAADLSKLMLKYQDVPMSLADACLVRLAEVHSECEVITLDSDFHVYRRNGRRLIPVRSPVRFRAKPRS